MDSGCLEGTGGPLCGLCESAWYLANGECVRCEEAAAAAEPGSGDVNASDDGDALGDAGSGSPGGRRRRRRRLADEAAADDGLFSLKAYDPATHRVNFGRWVQWGFMMGGCVAGLVLLLWKTTGDPLDDEAKKQKQQERLSALKARLLLRLRRKPPADKEGGKAAGDLAARTTVMMKLEDDSGDEGSSSAGRGIRPPPPAVMGRLPPRSPPPSPPASSPPPSPSSETPRLGQMRSSLRQLGVAEVGGGASLADLLGELKTGIGEKLKILITHFQIATSLKYTVNLSWPTDWKLVSGIDGW
eukprot:scaffold104476_cov67-Phaeocystis_antarctica.AAC.6